MPTIAFFKYNCAERVMESGYFQMRRLSQLNTTLMSANERFFYALYAGLPATNFNLALDAATLADARLMVLCASQDFMPIKIA